MRRLFDAKRQGSAGFAVLLIFTSLLYLLRTCAFVVLFASEASNESLSNGCLEVP